MKNAFSLHLLELRYRVLYIFFSFFITFFVGTYYSAPLTHLICVPFSSGVESGSFFIFTELTEGLYTAIQVDFVCALYFSFPLLIYQLHSFFIPSCYQKEQQQIDWTLFYILLLFLISLFVASVFVMPKICLFLQEYQYSSKCIQIKLQARIAPAVRWSCTAFFFTTLFFQVPILLLLFCRGNTTVLGFLLIKNRKYAFLFLLLIASFFSPPDVSIQCALAATGCILYEFFIWCALINQNWQNP